MKVEVNTVSLSLNCLRELFLNKVTTMSTMMNVILTTKWKEEQAEFNSCDDVEESKIFLVIMCY